jgi:hypothetical protein
LFFYFYFNGPYGRGEFFLFSSPAAYQKKRVIVSNTGERGGGLVSIESRGVSPSNDTRNFFCVFSRLFCCYFIFFIFVPIKWRCGRLFVLSVKQIGAVSIRCLAHTHELFIIPLKK